MTEVKLVDEDGNPINREDLELPDLTESDSDVATDSATVDTEEEDDLEKDEEQ